MVFYVRLSIPDLLEKTLNRSRFVLLVGFLMCSANCALGQRSLGLDLSGWQGNLRQSTWNSFHNIEGIEFAFIRSSRGGTTGYADNGPGGPSGPDNLSRRYDDPYFAQNITRATNAGMFAGGYHFSRPDIIASTTNSGGIANTGADEADHFIEMAGAWMRPGYLIPVHDLEAGQTFRTNNELAQFSIDFSDRIFEVMGIRPAMYANGNYARFVIGGASTSLKNEVVNKYPIFWNARPESNPNVQTENPSDYLSWTYGAWDDPPNPAQPWNFWQYSWTGNLTGYSGDLDLNVANGGIEYVKDRLVPALWTTSSDGDWSTLTNWNSGQTPIAPVQGPGQATRVGALTLPVERLPSVDDTIILDLSDADITVTLSSGNHEIRKLMVNEALNITGGALTINYIPHVESTPYSAKFSAPVSLSGGSLSVHTLQVDVTQTFSLSGGELTFDTLELNPHSTSPAQILVDGDVTFAPLNGASAAVVAGPGTGSAGFIDLGGTNRTWEVANGPATVDLAVDLSIINGGLTKTGPGVLELNGPSLHDGDTSVFDGFLNITDPILSDSADIYLVSGGAINLDYVGTDTIDSLFIDGVSAQAGTWGAVGSGAQFTSPQILGTGLLQVTTFEAPIPGDFNGDGMVDGTDLSQWQGDYSVNGNGDADDDGDSDGADFLAWQMNNGEPANPLAASQAVPEPSTALLLIPALFLARRSTARNQTDLQMT